MAGRTDGSSALQDDEPNITMTPGGASGDELPQPQSLGYRQIMQSVNNSMRSDFTGQALTPKGEAPEQGRSRYLKAALRNAENGAANTGSTSSLDANSGENNVSSDASSTAQSFKNNVGQKGGSDTGEKGGSNKVSGGGFLKKKGPLMSIIISLLFGGGGMYMTQASLPFTMLDKINDAFDSINISTNLRSSHTMRSIAKNTNNVLDGSAVTKKNVFGKEKFAPTKKMKKKLAANGISFGKKGTADAGKMIFTDADGVTKKMTVGEFKTEFDTNPEFRKAYSNGTKNWKTSVEEFADGVFDKLLKRFNISKNRFGDYDAKDDPDGTKGMKKMASDVDTSTNGGDINTKKTDATKTEAEYDNNGNKIKDEEVGLKDGGGSKTGDLKGTDTKTMADKLGSVKDVVGSLSTLGCGITKVFTAIQLIIMAAQLAQVVATAQEIFEGIDKARAGDAASSPINAIGRSLVEQTSEEKSYVKEDTVSVGADNETTMEYDTKTTEKRSAIQSEGLSSLFTGDPIDANDESVSGFVPSNAMKKAMTSVGSTIDSKVSSEQSSIDSFTSSLATLGFDFMDFTSTAILSYRTCLAADATMSAIELAVDAVAIVGSIISIAGAVFTGGASLAGLVASNAGKIAWEAIKLVLSACISIAVSAIIGWMTPVLANIFTRKLATEFMGEDLGNAVMSGGSAYLSRNHQAGGGLVANRNGYMAALTYQDKVNREEAKTDRLARSPFDYTSANTFAGQLAIAMTPVMLQSDSVGSAVGNFGSVIGNAARSLLPTASAISVQDKVNIAAKQTEENCPELYDMGVMADAFCNPYYTTDFSTIGVDENMEVEDSGSGSMYDVIRKVADYDSDNFKEGTDIDSVDNPSISLKNDSNLAKYILYCGQRTSPLGFPDQNIASDLDFDQLGTVAEGVVGVIPIIGDGLSILSDASIEMNYGYVSGGNCVMNDDGGADSERGVAEAAMLSYDEIKTYSRYAEDQRLAESMGLIDESAVSVALREYYDEHPLDNSTEGILARFSGLTKDNVIAIEDTVDFYNFYLAYDPTDYYPTPAVHKEDPTYTIEDKDFVNDDGMLAIMRACETDPARRLNVAAA